MNERRRVKTGTNILIGLHPKTIEFASPSDGGGFTPILSPHGEEASNELFSPD